MNWSDERYVRVYTRDTPDWQCLSFLAQGLFCLVLRKVDRAGVLPLGRSGRKAVAIAIGHAHQWPMLEPALEELLTDGCLRIEGDLLVAPNFLEAQEAEASDKARAKKAREKRRDMARSGGVTGSRHQPEARSDSSRSVTERHATTEHRDDSVTGCDGSGTKCDQTVTPSRAVPCRAEPEAAAAAMAAAAAPSGTTDDQPPRPALRVVDETGIPPAAPAHPLVAAFRLALADRLAVPADWLRVAAAERVAPVRDDLERELARVGIPAAVEASFEAAVREQRAGRRKPRHLAWYLRIVQDLTPEGALPAAGPQRQVLVGMDDAGNPIWGAPGTPFRGGGVQ